MAPVDKEAGSLKSCVRGGSVVCYTILGIIPSAGADMKPLVWLGSSRRNLKAFPKEVRYVFGHALFEAQLGRKHPDAKPLRGLKGGTVLEVVEDHAGNTYRAVYTVRFEGIVYVLPFQKKAKRGIRTPKRDVNLMKQRLREAEILHTEMRRTGKIR
jgi:phage-related protein